MISLREFLRDLAIDPMKLSDFVKDPKAVMDAAGLDEPSRRTLYSGSASAMWDLLLGRAGSDSTRLSPPAETGPDQRGSLVVVGTGIRTVGQLTAEAICRIRESAAVFYLVADPIADEIIRHLNPNGAESLQHHYGEGVHRGQSYEAMVQQILTSVRSGKSTCAAFYGHPGVFAYPSHESIRRARNEGFSARMLPAISAEDCLFADLGVDPAVNGCQSFEATDFLLHDRNVDISSQLVLWQVGVVGDSTYRTTGYNLGIFPLLVSRLCQLYGPGHVGTIYEAPILPGLAPVITQVALGGLTPAHVTAASTLYVPPARGNTINATVAAAMRR